MDLNTPIAELGFSHRTERLLRQSGVMTLEALAEQTDEMLLGVRGFGVNCLQEVRATLRRNGLHLGMKDSPVLSGMRQREGEMQQEAISANMVAMTTTMPSDSIDTGARDTGTEHPVQMASTNQEEECHACYYARAGENPCDGKALECHHGSPQAFFRQFGSGAIQHAGYWPTIPVNQWCGGFKVKEQSDGKA